MSQRLEIRLFGGLFIHLDGQPVTLISRKSEALLAYLACNGRAHPREALADLLFEEGDQQKVMTNLRVALNGLRQTLAFAIDAPRGSIALAANSQLWVDLSLFERGLAPLAKLSSTSQTLPNQIVEQIEAAVPLYTGDFLAGFSVRNAPRFEEWASRERERLRMNLLKALAALTGHYLATAQTAAGIPWAQQWVQHDALDELAHHRLMLLLARNGQRKAALDHFGQMQELWKNEFAAQPDASTLAVVKEIRQQELTPLILAAHAPLNPPVVRATAHFDLPALPQPPAVLPRSFLPPPHNLLATLMPIIGRSEELATISERLTGSACRLLTLVGIGGAGKTRLALEAAHRMVQLPPSEQIFRDGVYFVRLERIDSGELLPSAIAEAVGFSFQGKSEPQAQVVAYLRAKQLLLVMDNFEHLVEATEANIVLELLEAAPKLKILATSRERLNFQGEWLIELNGLPCPPIPKLTPIPLPNLLHNYPAAQLFIRSAEALQPDFAALNQVQAISQICQQLDGLPLALQLAAASVRAFSCAQIAEEIERNRDFLATTMRNVPARHRTLRAVFDHSWALLAPPDQRALQQLAIFEGSFTAEAAQQVAGVRLPTLMVLMDKSLLQPIGSEPSSSEASSALPLKRYKIHQALHQYVEERLNSVPKLISDLREQHCLYYSQLVQQQASDLHGPLVAQALNVISLELENVRAGWRYAAMQRRLDCLEGALAGLSEFYLFRGPLPEAQVALEMAVEQIGLQLADHTASVDKSSGRVALLLSRLLAEVARFLTERGLYERAILTSQQALTLAQACGDAESAALSYLQWGRSHFFQGHYQAAAEVLQQGFAVAQHAQLITSVAAIHNCLGLVTTYQGDYTAGRYHQQAATRIYHGAGERLKELNAYNNLAMVDFFAGDYASAKRIYEQYVADFRAIGDVRAIGKGLNNLGAVSTHLGIDDQAQAYYVEALQLKRTSGDRTVEGLILANLGLLAHRRQDDAQALTYCYEAIQISQEIGERDTTAYAQLCLGHALAGLGQWLAAHEAYQQALSLRRALGQLDQALEPLAGLARIALAYDDLPQAQAYVAELLPQLAKQTYAGIVELIRVYLTCYRVLQASGDVGARELLHQAQQVLQTRAAKISDAPARHSYLQQVAAHRELGEEYEMVNCEL